MWDSSKLEGMTPLVNPETGRDKLVHSYTCPFFGATVYDRAELVVRQLKN